MATEVMVQAVQAVQLQALFGAGTLTGEQGERAGEQVLVLTLEAVEALELQVLYC
ncbi:hypothetical protein [Desulfitobacterium hafniense]|uniref:hypothetical protein n=1 Tax=Desulfitobacterium hafniense TaxID=49338 RepID=UPI0012F97DAD|nr:hypothetical protein [Desulfitobacterium hafniense]